MKNDWFRTGDDTIKIRLKRGGKRGTEAVWTEIDMIDFSVVDSYPGSWVAKWNPTASTFYARRNSSYGHKGAYLHRVILGVEDRSIQIDHSNHNGLNNCRRNLVVSNVKLNGFNRRGAQKNSKSGIRNVYWNEREKKFMVWFVHNGKRFYFGYFEKAEDAEVVAERERIRFR